MRDQSGRPALSISFRPHFMKEIAYFGGGWPAGLSRGGGDKLGKPSPGCGYYIDSFHAQKCGFGRKGQ